MQAYLVALSHTPLDDWKLHLPMTINAESVHDAALIALEKMTYPTIQRMYAYVASSERDNIRPNGVPMVVNVLTLDILPE